MCFWLLLKSPLQQPCPGNLKSLAGLPATLERGGGDEAGPDLQHPADVLIQGWEGGAAGAFDTTVVFHIPNTSSQWRLQQIFRQQRQEKRSTQKTRLNVQPWAGWWSLLQLKQMHGVRVLSKLSRVSPDPSRCDRTCQSQRRFT